MVVVAAHFAYHWQNVLLSVVSSQWSTKGDCTEVGIIGWGSTGYGAWSYRL